MRTIEKLRRHPKWGGVWTWNYHDGYVRADGARYFGRARTSVCCMDACDHWRVSYYVSLPVHGPVRDPRRFPDATDRFTIWFEFEDGALTQYEEQVYDIGDSWKVYDS